ncbi:lysophospholipase L1-like esterase [Novosphingobium sp. PhB57]|uniref:SGNH/GDSL hydrolase family protein n=1 Tax=Novosphingobium sp. PhB57 TaxID=2485107 RepID=UPI001045AB77|nr:SGNH/GDSL hydrolase family protein [Novosphingobium sp. PhB57]TCU58195.1 lysophospholipase L1-like esterase [Novosphingobium sp. PhB57]
MKRLIAAAWLVPALAAPLAAPAAAATSQEHARPADEGWAGAWGYATSPATGSVKTENQEGTYRYRIRASQTGDAVRLMLSNPQGARSLHIAAISIARAAGAEGFALAAASRRPLAFAAGVGALIAGGQVTETLSSDFPVTAGEDLLVEIVTSGPSTAVAGNAAFPAAFAPGTVDAQGTALQPAKLRPLVTQLAVHNPAAACTIVTLGDSITEGARGTRPDWRGWPGVLSRRLIESRSGPRCGVVNMGISGNRLLREGRGTAAVDRFMRDVASVPSVSHLIVLEGVNDIWRATLPGEPALGASDLIAGYRRLIAAAHAKGIRIYGGTITPGFGWKAFTREMEETRQSANAWIRGAGEFDAVIDFDAALRDTSSPPMVQRRYDSGDHLHPGNGGYEAMGRAIPLSLFRNTP